MKKRWNASLWKRKPIRREPSDRIPDLQLLMMGQEQSAALSPSDRLRQEALIQYETSRRMNEMLRGIPYGHTSSITGPRWPF